MCTLRIEQTTAQGYETFMMLLEYAYKIQRALGQLRPHRTLDVFTANGGSPKGRALVSYMPLPLLGAAEHFRGHSNVWESSEIVRLFNSLGYTVDVIDWRDCRFERRSEYNVVFDIHRNLLRYSGSSARKIFHVTGSHPVFSNHAERFRLQALRERRGVKLQPRRLVAEGDLRIFEENLENADLVTLVGNEVTAETFPSHVRSKMRQVIATGSILPQPTYEYYKRRAEFLWFNGVGAVHKGLDLVLEVFARNPHLTLHVVGPFGKERDFVEAYRHELTDCPNIHAHGFLYPCSAKFRSIAARVAAFVNPTSSEGISTSAITCMQYGLIPIVSRQSGITLPPDTGILLQDNSPEEIERAVCSLDSEDPEKIGDLRKSAREFALEKYSRQAFSSIMEIALRQAAAS
jgi:glycosyltransferase involved in cell wall biosynthesis